MTEAQARRGTGVTMWMRKKVVRDLGSVSQAWRPGSRSGDTYDMQPQG